jgi:hypothetical protein
MSTGTSGIRIAQTHPSSYGNFAFVPNVMYTLAGPKASLNSHIFRHRNDTEGQNMGVKQTKQEIMQLKEQLKATNAANDVRLLKLAFVLVFVTTAAGILTGRVQLW